jgi:phosphate uptake regulator
MKRKLIQHGLSSLTISLPNKWVKENNLKKGEEIEVEKSNLGLIIKGKHSSENKVISIDVADRANIIRKILGAVYKSGYDSLKVNFSSYEELKEIKSAVQSQFSGYEIIKQEKNSVEIKKISEDNYENFDNALRRMFLIIGGMAEESIEAIKKEDYSWLKSISLMKYESDRLADYCRRAINLNFSCEYKRTAPLYTIIEQIEKISDEYHDLAIYISENKIKISEKIINLMEKLKELQSLFYKIFFKFSISDINYILEMREKIQKQIISLAESKKQDFWLLMRLDHIVNIISNLNGPLMAVYI